MGCQESAPFANLRQRTQVAAGDGDDFSFKDRRRCEDAEYRRRKQALMEELECDKDTAFESFIIKMNQTFNNEVDMYGDIQKAGDS